jgi:hypothetical protein
MYPTVVPFAWARNTSEGSDPRRPRTFAEHGDHFVLCERASISPRGGLISHSTDPHARRTSGVLLVAGFAALIPGFVVATGSQTGTSYIPPTFATRVAAISLIAGVCLTLLGLIAFDPVLWDAAGDRVLAGLGTAAYAAAAVSWIIATGRALALHEWTYELEVVFIVAAGFSMLAFGAAVLRTGVIRRWAGWVAVGWSTAGLILFALPFENYPPLLVQLVPLLFGIALLRGSGRAASRAPADLAE